MLEESIRRQVLAAGAAIAQAAQAYPQRDVAPALDALDRVLDRTTTRLNELATRLLESRHAGAGDTLSSPQVQPADRRSPAQPSAPTDAALRRAEYTLIGGCVAISWIRELAQERLHLDDFSSPEAAATWIALDELARRGGPVDYVLLAAQVQRLGEHPEYGHGIEPLSLAKLARRSDVVSASRAVTEVVRAALARAAGQAERVLAAAGSDHTQTSGELLATARGTLERIDAIRRRLDGQTGPRPTEGRTPANNAPKTSGPAARRVERPRSTPNPTVSPPPTVPRPPSPRRGRAR